MLQVLEVSACPIPVPLKDLVECLAQQLSDKLARPTAYASRCLQPHEKNHGITELEALGVMWAVKYFQSNIIIQTSL